jgi:hypothetical protein
VYTAPAHALGGKLVRARRAGLRKSVSKYLFFNIIHIGAEKCVTGYFRMILLDN